MSSSSSISFSELFSDPEISQKKLLEKCHAVGFFEQLEIIWQEDHLPLLKIFLGIYQKESTFNGRLILDTIFSHAFLSNQEKEHDLKPSLNTIDLLDFLRWACSATCPLLGIHIKKFFRKYAFLEGMLLPYIDLLCREIFGLRRRSPEVLKNVSQYRLEILRTESTSAVLGNLLRYSIVFGAQSLCHKLLKNDFRIFASQIHDDTTLQTALKDAYSLAAFLQEATCCYEIVHFMYEHNIQLSQDGVRSMLHDGGLLYINCLSGIKNTSKSYSTILKMCPEMLLANKESSLKLFKESVFQGYSEVAMMIYEKFEQNSCTDLIRNISITEWAHIIKKTNFFHRKESYLLLKKILQNGVNLGIAESLLGIFSLSIKVDIELQSALIMFQHHFIKYTPQLAEMIKIDFYQENFRYLNVENLKGEVLHEKTLSYLLADMTEKEFGMLKNVLVHLCYPSCIDDLAFAINIATIADLYFTTADFNEIHAYRKKHEKFNMFCNIYRKGFIANVTSYFIYKRFPEFHILQQYIINESYEYGRMPFLYTNPTLMLQYQRLEGNTQNAKKVPSPGAIIFSKEERSYSLECFPIWFTQKPPLHRQKF